MASKPVHCTVYKEQLSINFSRHAKRRDQFLIFSPFIQYESVNVSIRGAYTADRAGQRWTILLWRQAGFECWPLDVKPLHCWNRFSSLTHAVLACDTGRKFIAKYCSWLPSFSVAMQMLTRHSHHTNCVATPKFKTNLFRDTVLSSVKENAGWVWNKSVNSCNNLRNNLVSLWQS